MSAVLANRKSQLADNYQCPFHIVNSKINPPPPPYLNIHVHTNALQFPESLGFAVLCWQVAPGRALVVSDQ